jgi:hypothetical protein
MKKIFEYFFWSLIVICLVATGLWRLTKTGSLMLVENKMSASLLSAVENPSPVFPTLIPDQAYVIKDDVNYKLYYADCDAITWICSINLAQSPDGVTWTPYVGNPVLAEGATQGEHADVHFYSAGFTGANSGTNPSAITMYYRMWYQGAVAGIANWRYAESPDGINWYNRVAVAQFGTPVFSAQTGAAYGIADAVYTPGASNTGTDWTFRIYVNVQWEVAPYGGNELVIMAFSSDGYNWTGYDPTSVGYATPIFAGTLDGVSFDTDHISWFKVIKNSATDWLAFYSGGKGTTFQALNGIGYATSHDGINWVRRQALFTTNDPVAWRNQSVWMPSVVKSGIDYEIFFLGSDYPGDIGGSDWIQWKLGGATLTPIPVLNVIKNVINDSGGTAVPSDFTMHVKNGGVDVSGSPLAGIGTPGTLYNLPAGTYTVGEDAHIGYASSFSGDCDSDGSVTLSAGDEKTCTITNDDIAPQLTVTKTVINNNGGTKTVSNFPLFIDGVSVTSGVASTTSIGSHTVSETSDSGYTATIGGDCAADGTITLSLGDAKTCTITNDDIQPSGGGGGNAYFAVSGLTPTTTPTTTTTNEKISAIQAQLNELSATLHLLQTQEGQQPTPTIYQFTRYLQLRDIGADVKQLQVFLNNHGFVLAANGPGSPGKETSKFGFLTKQALINFQEANFDAILKPAGFQKGTGMFYQYTMRFVNNILLSGE